MILLIPYFLLELYFSLAVGSSIGFLGSVLWIFITFIIGMGLIQNSAMTIQKSMTKLAVGKLNMKTFHDSATSYFLGALLLMIPGVFSDILGVIALLYTFYLQLGGTISNSKNKTNINKQGDTDVIDVEIIESSHSSHLKP
ncbi:hypothetical protein MNB_SV-13-488 [hydrothermal vent metagenome]|uniref:FxsA protein n=1 Tax=hydrothermal vent metagenome TaxID=652676 RepID=A0A1W1BNE7_9ZZZZ